MLLHQNAQRLLEPLAVVNPHAGSLAFPDAAVRARRDHVKYLTLIAAVTLLHQHQRQVKTVTRGGQAIRYVETARADIELADRLAGEVLARSLDELPPGTRRLLDAIAGYVTARCEAEGLDRDLVRFTRRQLREALSFGDTQLKVHLARLADYELVIPHRLDSGGFCYQLAWQPPADGSRNAPATADRSALEGHWSAGGRPPVGGSAPGRPAQLRRAERHRVMLGVSHRCSLGDRGSTPAGPEAAMPPGHRCRCWREMRGSAMRTD